MSVCSPHLKKDKKKLESVQRRATKQINGLSELGYVQRLKLLKLPTLVYRRLRVDMIDVYKMLNKIYDPDVSNFLLLNGDVVGRPTRGHHMKLFKRRAMGAGCKKIFFFAMGSAPLEQLAR